MFSVQRSQKLMKKLSTEEKARLNKLAARCQFTAAEMQVWLILAALEALEAQEKILWPLTLVQAA